MSNPHPHKPAHKVEPRNLAPQKKSLANGKPQPSRPRGHKPKAGPHRTKEDRFSHPKKLAELLPAWDQMMVAKYYPGQIDAPYVAAMGMPPIPTGVFHGGADLTEAESGVSQVTAAIGIDNYTLICFCPSLSMYHGSGAFGRVGTGDKLSGLTVQVENSASAPILYKDGFDVVTRTRTMSELYGSDTTGFAQAGLVWAAELEMTVLAPAANLTGAHWQGAITIGQIPVGGLSIAQLQAISGRSSSANAYRIRGAVMNNNAVYDQIQNAAANPANAFDDMSLEVVHFLIVERAAVDITSGAKQVYSLAVQTRGNFAFWPSAMDSFANSLYRTPENSPDRPRLADHVYDPLSSIGGVMPYIGKALSLISASSPGGWLGRALPLAANALAPWMVAKQATASAQENIIVSTNQRALESLMVQLNHFVPRDSEVAAHTSLRQILLAWRSAYSRLETRLTPLHDQDLDDNHSADDTSVVVGPKKKAK